MEAERRVGRGLWVLGQNLDFILKSTEGSGVEEEGHDFES